MIFETAEEAIAQANEAIRRCEENEHLSEREKREFISRVEARLRDLRRRLEREGYTHDKGGS